MLEKITEEMPKHISLANQFAAEVINQFNEFEANEIMEQVKFLILEDRQKEISKTSEKLEFLRKSLEKLQTI
jgi:hypothetical protein